MSWRSGATGFTGSNNIPLGNRRRFRDDGAPGDDGGYNPSQPSAGMPMGEKRGRSPEPRSTTATGASSKWSPFRKTKANELLTGFDSRRRRPRRETSQEEESMGPGRGEQSRRSRRSSHARHWPHDCRAARRLRDSLPYPGDHEETPNK